MKRILGLSLFLMLLSTSTFAQHNIQGKVLDKKDESAIEMATIRLLNAKDSALVQGCFTDEKGYYTLNKIKNGNYILEVRFLGYLTQCRNISVADKALVLRTVFLSESQKVLKEVEVRGMTAQMAVKGDTIEYNTAAFKTAENAVVEDLLKKLPGVVVDADGKITVNGEEIKKVRVDGKKFFGDDIQMATKNIPVDMVDKVQVVDQKSEMAQLTGFEDDNTERIINLTIKANRKKGIFGNISAGGGADKDGEFRYDNNAFLNIMRGESQTALIAGANNTNTQRSGRGRDGMTGGGGGGITETQNIGINNNTEINKNLKIGGNSSYNHTTNTSESSSEKTNYLSDTTESQTNNESKARRENHQANMRLELEWNIDTLSTLIVQPEINYTRGFSDSRSEYVNYTDGDSISYGKTNNNSVSNGLDGNLRFIFSRKSKVKKGRTFTANLYGSLSQSDSDGKNYSKKYTLETDSTTLVDQRTENTSKSYSTDLRTSFVEPLWDLKNFIEISTSFRSSIRSAEKMQYDKDDEGVYNVLDTTYSNRFDNYFFNEALELNFRHQDQSYNYMLGIKAEPSQTYSTTDYLSGSDVDRNISVVNYSPTASFRYNFGRKKFARLEYRGRTSQPSIEQMQPVKNNNNLMNETVGNMDLNPSFEQSLRLMYSSFNQERYSSFSAGLNGAITKDALVTNSVYDETGKQYSQTVNSEKMPFNASANVMFNTPIIKNRLQFNTRSEISYQQKYGYSITTTDIDADNLILGNLGKTKNAGANQNLSLTFTTDVVEVGLRGTVKYSSTENTLTNKDQETTDWTGSGNLNLHLPYSFTVSNDLSYTTREGYSSYTKDEWVWNASVDKSVFKKKGTLSLKLYDILQQKLNVSETIGDNYRTLSKYNTLTSYFTLSFTYKIAKFGGGASSADMFRGGGRRNGGGMGPGGFGGGGPDM
jgi:hypothetical protein